MVNFGSDRFWKLAALASLGVALALAGCGRKGPLELPPSAQAPQNAKTRAAENADPLSALGGQTQSDKKKKKPEAFDANGQPTAPSKTNRTSILDGMLD